MVFVTASAVDAQLGARQSHDPLFADRSTAHDADAECPLFQSAQRTERLLQNAPSLLGPGLLLVNRCPLGTRRRLDCSRRGARPPSPQHPAITGDDTSAIFPTGMPCADSSTL
ncbi:hypothetical protein ADK74_22135 [Streptomyces decoyicus]|nr:hypothetical protein ADK74_22135 [Streptomyces decoyicus]